MAEDRRSALVEPPYKLAVAPSGRIAKVRIATNLRSAVFLRDGEDLVLRSEARKAGWLELKDACDSEAQYEKLVAYFEFEEANRGQVKRPPDSALPKICRERRSKANELPSFFDEPPTKKTSKKASTEKPPTEKASA